MARRNIGFMRIALQPADNRRAEANANATARRLRSFTFVHLPERAIAVKPERINNGRHIQGAPSRLPCRSSRAFDRRQLAWRWRRGPAMSPKMIPRRGEPRELYSCFEMSYFLTRYRRLSRLIPNWRAA